MIGMYVHDTHDQSLLWRTRRWVPDRGFLTTIQNIMDVARLSAYLEHQYSARTRASLYSPRKDVLRVVVSQIHGRGPTNRNTFRFSFVACE